MLLRNSHTSMLVVQGPRRPCYLRGNHAKEQNEDALNLSDWTASPSQFGCFVGLCQYHLAHSRDMTRMLTVCNPLCRLYLH